MPREPCEPIQPISRATRLGATGTVSTPCPQHLRWLEPIWQRLVKAMRCQPCAVALPPSLVRGVAGHPLDTKHPAIRETLRGIGRKYGSLARRAAAITTAEVRKLCRACGPDLAGARDQAMFLLGFAGALRRSELVGLDVEHVTWTGNGLTLLIERSKTDAQGDGAEIAIPHGQAEDGSVSDQAR